MQITRRNPFTGEHITWNIAVTSEQLHNWKQGMLIQDAMPDLTADEREFIMTGITPDQYETLFKNK